jgi:geranylgeranyl diphosphate synthase type II
MNLKEYFELRVSAVNQTLDQLLPPEDTVPPSIHKAMRYSVFAGGKRFRPILTLAAGEAFGAAVQDLLPTACALELIHTYSLIHDDLPALDNDDLRRGRPTCHRVFGEAMAILAGDALLTRAFKILSDSTNSNISDGQRIRLLNEVSSAAATENALIGGQVLDIESEGKQIDASALEQIHNGKTGAMIRVAVRAGAVIAGVDDATLNQLTIYADKMGLAFQIADDLLDITATSEQLGKTPGKDAAVKKATYPAVYGIEASKRLALHLSDGAVEALTNLNANTDMLAALARFVVDRNS